MSSGALPAAGSLAASASATAAPADSKPRRSGPAGRWSAVPAISAVCAASMAMLFSNKLLLSVYGFDYAACLLAIQSIIAVLALQLLAAAKVITVEAFTLDRALKWAPVTIFFGLMLYTGSKSLIYLSIPVLTVFKNMTNLLIAYGDWYFFDERVNTPIIMSFVLMIVGSIMTGYYDLEFSLRGYLWMATNCLSQAAYVLYMRQAKKTTQLSEWGMSLYNNALCIGLMAVTAVLSGEISAASRFPDWDNAGFLVSLIFSGVVGTCLSLSVFWCISVTSPTTYSMIGALNKIPITFLSVLFFHVAFTWKTAISVTVGLSAGIVYTQAKLNMPKQPKKDAAPPEYIVVDKNSSENGRDPSPAFKSNKLAA